MRLDHVTYICVGGKFFYDSREMQLTWFATHSNLVKLSGGADFCFTYWGELGGRA